MENKTERLNGNTTLTECFNGFWLWDENRGMNLSMKAISEKAALVEALEYYQDRLLEVEEENKKFRKCFDAVSDLLPKEEV